MTPSTTLRILATALLAAASNASSAQTAKPATTVHRTVPAHPAIASSGGCVTIPQLSSSIPALPAGTQCPRALLTFTSSPAVKLEYVSPLVTPEVRDSLGLTPSSFSLDYSEVKAGNGPLALPKKYYTVNYTGYLTNGTKFDSSLDPGKKPFTFPIGAHRVIVGWDLGLQGMHLGGKRRLYIPWQLAYGERGQPPTIPAKSELIFDIELISQSDTDPNAPAEPPTPKPATAPAAAPAASPAAVPTATPPATTPPATATPKP